MITEVSAFGASLAFVFFKAFQQRNVAFDHFRWVMPTSMGMALTEFYVVALVAKHGYSLPLVLAAGAGAGLGAIAAMTLHARFVGRGKRLNVSTSLTAQGVTEERDQ